MVAVFGCSAEEQSEPPAKPPVPPVTRDSVGVRIVENTTPQWRRGTGWRLSRDPIVTIGPDESDVERGPLDPATAFIAPNGEIVLLDGMYGGWHRGLVFDSTGRFVRYLGRKGNGPCEFQQIVGGFAYRGDSVAIYDIARYAIFVMSIDGRCGRMVSLPERPRSTSRDSIIGGGRVLGSYRDGRFLHLASTISRTDEALSWSSGPIVQVSPAGDSTHTIGEFPVREVARDIARRSFWPTPRFYNAEVFIKPYESGIVVSENTRAEVRVHDASGALKFIARRPHEPVPIRDRDKRIAVSHRMQIVGGGERASGAPAPKKSMQERIDEISWPEFKPFHSNLLVDGNGNLWLEEYRFPHWGQIPEKPTPIFWSVFDRDGTWLGRVEVPGRLLVRNIYDDRLIGIWKDEDAVASVRVYRLDK